MYASASARNSSVFLISLSFISPKSFLNTKTLEYGTNSESASTCDLMTLLLHSDLTFTLQHLLFHCNLTFTLQHLLLHSDLTFTLQHLLFHCDLTFTLQYLLFHSDLTFTLQYLLFHLIRPSHDSTCCFTVT